MAQKLRKHGKILEKTSVGCDIDFTILLSMLKVKMHFTIELFHPCVLYSKLIKKQTHIMVQRCQKRYRGTYFYDVIYIALL